MNKRDIAPIPIPISKVHTPARIRGARGMGLLPATFQPGSLGRFVASVCLTLAAGVVLLSRDLGPLGKW